MSWLKARDWSSGVEYSSLLNSGLRAITGRRPSFPTGTNSSSRRNSTAILSTPPSRDDDSGSSKVNPSARHNRRSSIISLSSKLLTRARSSPQRKGSATEGSPTPRPARKERKGPANGGEKTVKPRPSSMFVHASYQIPDLWPVRKGRFSSFSPAASDTYTFEEELEGPEYDESVDPFSSAPNAKSYILDIRALDMPPTQPPSSHACSPSPSPRAPAVLSSSPILSPEDRASFLSLAPPTPDTSSPSPSRVRTPPPRRARPVSAQTMPALRMGLSSFSSVPSSRRDSVHYGYDAATDDLHDSDDVYSPYPDPPPYYSSHPHSHPHPRDNDAGVVRRAPWMLEEDEFETSPVDCVPQYHRDGDAIEIEEVSMLDLSDGEEDYDDYDGVLHERERLAGQLRVGLGLGRGRGLDGAPAEWVRGGAAGEEEDWRRFHVEVLQTLRPVL
ncbi:hypothetical protein CONPUDRAFT_80355 [Coniophora puteana RWD-64-598 SS2]|uniref:Uncharacterized protein n=1 Tax=Coniophora puteana (strain RWD-64-598) TaxID=741705 RepID=A0A5M3MXK3_CONPW|nr:uncharacterized protein CONPUDRAFT_80355 [Coniophora puteana RWD-64-598 SS2]EIW83727.1 hypothetical protein CONPUDRAFT_80355 [Coniophora puteana RWD-64-598 SS2]